MKNNYAFYKEILHLIDISKIKNSKGLEQLKESVSAKFRQPLPSNSNLRKEYLKLLSKGEISKSDKVEKWLKSKRIRSLSGVAVVAVLTKPFACKGECLYCPQEKGMPKSYLSNEPAVMRAIKVKFDPYLQVQKRLRALELNGHSISKIELIVMGGTFSHLPLPYRYEFVLECFRACNEYPICKKIREEKKKSLFNIRKGLNFEQRKNEKARVRVVGLTLETRPDCIFEEEIKLFRELGCTRVELGVQSVYNSVLKYNRRGHKVKDTVRATKSLKDNGFKISYHMMLGLPESDLKKDYLSLKKIFSNQKFRPDLLKIYPCVVTKDSELYNLWKNKLYEAYTKKKTEDLIIKIKKIIPRYVRISRVIRDIPATSIIAGPNVSNLRQLIGRKAKCQCIRCREIKNKFHKEGQIIYKRTNYQASDGKEIFLEYVTKKHDRVCSLLRLRIPSKRKNALFPELSNSAIIREVHTYGKALDIWASGDKKSAQHGGMGRKLMAKAEKIAKVEFGINKMAVISGVGVRDYYRKLGYNLESSYMVKRLQK